MPRHFVLSACFLLIVAPSLFAAGPEPLATQEEIQKAYASGQYAQVLQKLTRVLVLKGKAAEPYDRHALLRLKGEAHLHMKALVPAAQAFAEAAKETNDGPSTALDLSTELLIKKSSPGLVYQPKAKDPTDKTKSLSAMDIGDPENRKKAIELLFADEWAVIEAKVNAIRLQRTLPPILESLPAIRNVRWLEMASTGKDEKSKELVVDLQKRAKTILDTTIKDMTENTDSIEKSAAEVVTASVPVNDKQTGKILGFRTEFRYRGPTPKQNSALQDVAATSLKIRDSSDELGGSLGATGKEFDSIKDSAGKLAGKAKNLLNVDWRKTYLTPPPSPVK